VLIINSSMPFSLAQVLNLSIGRRPSKWLALNRFKGLRPFERFLTKRH